MTTDADFVVWGAGRHGKVVADLIRDQFGKHVVLAYVDHDPQRVGIVAEPGGSLISLTQERLFDLVDHGELRGRLVLAVGDNQARFDAFSRVRGKATLPTLVHPTAHVSPSASLGEATQVCARVVVHSSTVVGHATILNTGCIVEHDCVIGDACHISPGAVLTGGVQVASQSWVGAGATVLPDVRIGERACVGAGAVVTRDVPDGRTVVGNPARILR